MAESQKKWRLRTEVWEMLSMSIGHSNCRFHSFSDLSFNLIALPNLLLCVQYIHQMLWFQLQWENWGQAEKQLK